MFLVCICCFIGKQRATTFGFHSVVGHVPNEKVCIKEPVLFLYEDRIEKVTGCPKSISDRIPDIKKYWERMQDLGCSDMASVVVKETVRARRQKTEWVQAVAKLLTPDNIPLSPLVDMKGNHILRSGTILDWPKVTTTKWSELKEQGDSLPWLTNPNVDAKAINVAATDEEIKAMVGAIAQRVDKISSWREGIGSLSIEGEPATVLDYITVAENTKSIEKVHTL